jgi:glutamate synthase (NADPH/NADH) large chain
MTGGSVVVLGLTGRNFAAGMSGGTAFVFDTSGSFSRRCNRDLVEIEALQSLEDLELVKSLVTQHLHHTDSQFAARLLDDWSGAVPLFVKIMPRDYKRVLAAQRQAAAEGRTPEFSELVGVRAGG